jgi:uncharacterized membrane protein
MIKRYLITGLLVVVPILITVYVLVIAFQFLDGILGRFLSAYLKNLLGFYIPGIGIALIFISIFLVGFLVTRFIGKKIFSGIEGWFSGLPLINKIYPSVKQIVKFILAQKEFGFKKVVLVEYPSKGIWSVGFLTNEQFNKIKNTSGEPLVAVFVPSSPGPLTGYVIFVRKEDTKFVDMTVSDALKIIISGGVVVPEN